MNHESWLEQADIYALGALDAGDLARFEPHLATGCPTCSERVRGTRDALALLPRSLRMVAPPPHVRARVMERIATERPSARQAVAPRPDPRRLSWFASSGWATTSVAVGLLLAASWHLSATRAELGELESRFGALQERIATLQGEVAAHEETLRFLSDPEVRYVSLRGLPPSPRASGWLSWNPRTRQGLLLTANLPRASADRVYELWAIARAEPLPAGLFTVDQGGRAMLRLPTLPEGRSFDKFAVTLEPAGGLPKPPGPMHLLGSL